MQIFPFTERGKDLLQKIRVDMVGGPSIVFTRKAVVDKTFIRKSTNLCKSIVDLDTSQLYPHSMCQLTPTRIYTRWDLDRETGRFILDRTRPAALKIWSILIFNEQNLNVKLKASIQQVDRRKLKASVLMGFTLIATLSFKLWDAFITFAPVRNYVPL